MCGRPGCVVGEGGLSTTGLPQGQPGSAEWGPGRSCWPGELPAACSPGSAPSRPHMHLLHLEWCGRSRGQPAWRIRSDLPGPRPRHTCLPGSHTHLPGRPAAWARPSWRPAQLKAPLGPDSGGAAAGHPARTQLGLVSKSSRLYCARPSAVPRPRPHWPLAAMALRLPVRARMLGTKSSPEARSMLSMGTRKRSSGRASSTGALGIT